MIIDYRIQIVFKSDDVSERGNSFTSIWRFLKRQITFLICFRYVFLFEGSWNILKHLGCFWAVIQFIKYIMSEMFLFSTSNTVCFTSKLEKKRLQIYKNKKLVYQKQQIKKQIEKNVHKLRQTCIPACVLNLEYYYKAKLIVICQTNTYLFSA